jgi:biopolymer transport protein TolQ
MIDPVTLDPLTLLREASLPIRATAGLLVTASAAVWIVGVFKLLQLSRLAKLQGRFERHARRADSLPDLESARATVAAAPGARIVSAITSLGTSSRERLRAVADRAIVEERKQATAWVGVLGTSAAVAPFVGLFGTVYGIMDAFVRIGAAKSASLPVVAPAIGEALLTTAIGLAVAIPAVVFYNLIDRRVGELVAALESSAPEWVEIAMTPAQAAQGVPAPRPAAPPVEAPATVRQRMPRELS